MGDQQFILRWHLHESTLIHNMPFFIENDILTDITICVGSQHVKAHRIVLAMCSVYFLQLFQEMRNTQHPVIVLHNVSLEDLKAVLSFMYRGQCVISKEQLPSLLSVAKLLKVQGLCDMNVPEKETMAVQSEQVKVESTPNEPKCDQYKRQDSDIENPSYTQKDRISPQWEKGTASSPEILPTFPPKKLIKESETCKCFLCGKYLSNQYNLRVHMETHEETFHACQSCPHVSRSRDALRKHVSYRHPEEYHTRKRKKLESNY